MGAKESPTVSKAKSQLPSLKAGKKVKLNMKNIKMVSQEGEGDNSW